MKAETKVPERTRIPQEAGVPEPPPYNGDIEMGGDVGVIEGQAGQAEIGLRPVPMMPRIPIWLDVSGRYEAYGPILRRDPLLPRIPLRIPLPRPGSVADVEEIEQVGPTEELGALETELDEDLDELSPTLLPFARESLMIDVDGRYPQMTASGTLTFRFATRVHWIAKLVKRSRNYYVGRIWYKEGSTRVFPYNVVEIRIVNSYFPTRKYASVRFSRYWGGPARTRRYNFKSRAYRSVEFEFDCAEGTRAVTAINTHAHPNRPAALPHEILTIPEVFQRAGFTVRTTGATPTVPLSLSGADNRWSDMEMHDAMQVYWSRFANRAQWSMWVFFAALHERGTSLGGIMFDDIGPNHRQGTSIFEDSFINNAPSGESHPTAYVNRMKFWTACHEMGHSFNLAHSWQKELGTPWHSSVTNEPEARSFMNYPYNVSGGQAAFFNNFDYKFSDQELLFMRHAPERLVEMGAADWFDHHAFEQAETPPTPSFELELRVNRHVKRNKACFEFLEPVMVELKLKNISDDPHLVPANILEDYGRLTFIIKRKGERAKEFRPYAQYCFRSNPVALMPHDAIYETTFISAGQGGFYIDKPGDYTIQASIKIDDHDHVSNPMQIRIEPARGYEDDLIAQDFFNDQVGRILRFNGSNVLEDGNDALQETVDRLPGRRVTMHAQLALAASQCRACKVLNIGDTATELTAVHKVGGLFNVTTAHEDAAKTTLTAALTKDMTGAAETLGHIGLNNACRHFGDWLTEIGEGTQAADVTKKLHGTLAKRGVITPVLDDIKTRGEKYAVTSKTR